MSELSLSKIQRIFPIDPPVGSCAFLRGISARLTAFLLTQELRKRFPTPDDGAGEPPPKISNSTRGLYIDKRKLFLSFFLLNFSVSFLDLLYILKLGNYFNKIFFNFL
jgi:hypothetical protein